MHSIPVLYSYPQAHDWIVSGGTHLWLSWHLAWDLPGIRPFLNGTLPFCSFALKISYFWKTDKHTKTSNKGCCHKRLSASISQVKICMCFITAGTFIQQTDAKKLGGTESNKVLLCCYTALQFQASALTHIFWESNRKSLISFFYLHGKPNIAISYISVSWFYVDKIWWQGDLLFSQMPPPPPLSLLHHCHGQ